MRANAAVQAGGSIRNFPGSDDIWAEQGEITGEIVDSGHWTPGEHPGDEGTWSEPDKWVVTIRRPSSFEGLGVVDAEGKATGEWKYYTTEVFIDKGILAASSR